jgi:hypothetical protein
MRVLPLSVLLLIATACSDDSNGAGADAGPADAPAALDGGLDADLCTGGTLCGTPATCCPAGNECADDRCLPDCASGVRCGAALEICCDDGTVCLAGGCATPGEPCTDSYDCDPGHFCEPTLGRCLPQPDPVTCEIIPDFSDLTVLEEWSYTDEQIISIPLVADLDGDTTPEVVLNLTVMDGLGWVGGRIAILDGDTGAVEVAPIPEDPGAGHYGSYGRATAAVGDVSGDGLPDVIYAGRATAAGSLIVAIDGDGALLWVSHDGDGVEVRLDVQNGGATLANFDDDPEAEIVFGATLIDDDGTVVWDGGAIPGAGAAMGGNDGYAGGISAVADLDDDGHPEIVSGANAWKVDWTPGTPPTVDVSTYWTHAGPDGYPAIADLDLDGAPEVVLVASSTVRVLEGQTGLLWCGAGTCADDAARTQPRALPGSSSQNRGGPPTIADFDADGRPEIGVAGGYAYAVFDVNRPGEELPDGVTADPGAFFVRWWQPTQDLSSNATGSAVFDFQGDGAAEVVYADECAMRAYSGVDGAVYLELPSTTGTIHEYPVVVDVDADGNSEILIVANDESAAANCPGVAPRRGLYVYGDPLDQWVPTRRVWTQHDYHVTNATSAGNVPLVETANWSIAALNNDRQNVQGEGVFNAPDLAVDLAVTLDGCPADKIGLRARVTNLGALGVPAGVPVVFYQGADASGVLLDTVPTPTSLLPGQSLSVEIIVVAPVVPTDYYVIVDPTSGVAPVAECDDANNDDLVTAAACPIVG